MESYDPSSETVKTASRSFHVALEGMFFVSATFYFILSYVVHHHEQ